MTKYVIKRTIDPKAGADAFVRPKRNEGIALPLEEALRLISIGALGDVDLTGLKDGYGLIWSAVDNKFVAGKIISSAADVMYDDTNSALGVSNVQDAIDELDNRIDNLESRYRVITITTMDWTLSADGTYYYYDVENDWKDILYVKAYEKDMTTGNLNFIVVGVSLLYDSENNNYPTVRLMITVNDTANPSTSLPSGDVVVIMGR